MLKIGVTGGIGSGKSLICKMFEMMGIPVYMADYEAKQLYNKDLQVREQLIAHFGEEVYLHGGEINRKRLAEIIFNDEAALDVVNEIVHPVVYADFRKWTEKHTDKPYVLHESAILFESGIGNELDGVMTVTAPLELRIKRVIERDRVRYEDVAERIRNQMPEEEKIARADYVIYNDEKKLVLPQIIKIDATLRELSQK